MGAFGGGLESIGIEFDPRSILAGIQRVNQDLEKLEGGTSKTTDTLKRDWTSVVDILTRVSDRSKNASDSYIRSLERQAAAAGKSGIDKLNAQMEQAIKNYGYSEAAINKITVAYEKMRKAQEAAKPPAPESGSELNSRYLIFGAKDLMEGRVKYAAAEAINVIQGLSGAPAIIGGTVAGIIALTGAVYEGSKALAEWGVQQRDLQIKTGLSAKELGEFSYAAKAVGTDTSVVERLMRGLTMAVEDTSSKGEKARDVLRGMGVDVQGLRDGVVPVGDVLRQVSTAFKENGDVLSRDKEALDLFKRAGIEAVPFLSELNDNLKHASQAGFGFDQTMINAGASTQKVLADMETRWDHIKLKIEDASASILGIIVNQTKWDDTFQKYEQFQQKQSGVDGGIPNIAKLRNSGLQVTLTNSRLQHDLNTTESGLERQLNLARQRAQTAAESYFTIPAATSPEKEDRAHDDWVRAEADVKKFTDALRKLHDEQNKTRRQGDEEAQFLLGVRSRTELQAETPLRRVLTERDSTLREVQEKFSNRPESERQFLTAKVSNYYAQAFVAQLQKDLRASQEKAAKELNSETEERLKIESSLVEEASKQAAQQSRQGLLPVAPGGPVISLSQLSRASGTPPGPSSKQQAELTKDMLSQESKRIELMAGPGGELAAARQIIDLKKQALAIDEQQAELEAQSITDEFQRAQKIYDIRLEYARQVYDAESQYQDKLLEKQKELAQLTAGLYHTLLTNPSQFPKQLENTVKEAALKPVTQTLGNITAGFLAPFLYGTGGKVGGLSDVTSTNGAMHVFVTNFGARGGEGGTAALPFFGASGPLFSGATASGPSYYPGPGGGYPGAIASSLGLAAALALPMSNPAFSIGPGGTAGFLPGLLGLTSSDLNGSTIGSAAGSGFGGLIPASAPLATQVQGSLLSRIFGGGGGLFGGGTRTGGFGGILGRGGIGGLGGFGNLGGLFGIGTASPVPAGAPAWATAPGSPLGIGGGTSFSSVLGSPAAGMAGMFLASQGLLGKNAGSGLGVIEGTAGGALIGMQYGGPIGAAIGAGVGLATGLGELLAGVEPQWKEAERLVKQLYNISIPQAEGQKIADLANQKYGGKVSVAVRSQDVRQMLGIYAAGTGQSQNSVLSSLVPRAGSLAEQGGVLYQQATYSYGTPYAYQSNLPVLGGPVAGTYPSSSSSPNVTIQGLSLSVGEKGAADFLAGNVVTSDFIASGFSDAQNASNGRLQNSAMTLQPGLITG